MVVKAPAGEGAAPLVSWKAQWHSFHSALSSEVNICKDCGGVFHGQDCEVPKVGSGVRAIGVLGCESCWHPPVLLLCLRKKVLAERILLGATSGILTLRAVAELGYWGQVHMELPWCLGPGHRCTCCGSGSGV